VADRVDRVAAIVRAQRGHDLVVLPELWAPGGFAYETWESRADTTSGAVATAMAGAARDAGLTLHAGSIVETSADGSTGPEGKDLWNTSLVFGPDGALLASYRKIHRFGFGIGEPRLMEAGERVVTTPLPDGAGGTVTAGLSTCYDLRFPELYRAQLDAGATVFVIPAAWPRARVAHWTLLAHARAIENQCVVIAVNTAGTHSGHEMGGHSQVVMPTGEAVAVAGLGEQVLSVDVDLGEVDRWRAAFPVLADRRLPDRAH
jgi:predicted amidohydrolase